MQESELEMNATKVRASLVRVALTHLFKDLPFDAKLTLPEVMGMLGPQKLLEIGNPDKAALYYQLAQMAKNGWLQVETINHSNHYSKAAGFPVNVDNSPVVRKPRFKEAPEPQPVRDNTPYQQAPQSNNLAATIRLEVVKSTGNIRIGLGNLTIEIGEVDK